MEGVTIVSHPLVQHKLTLLRSSDTSTKSFRELLKEIGMLLCYEVTRDLPRAAHSSPASFRDRLRWSGLLLCHEVPGALPPAVVDIEPPLAKMKSPEIS